MKFTELGAMVAFATGAFVLFDRLVSGRPVATLVKRSNNGRALQLANTSKNDIIIRRIKIWGKSIYIAPDASLDGITVATLSMPFSKVLEPGEKVDFPVMVRNGKLLEEGAPWTPFFVIISWRKTSSMWLPQPAKFWLSSVRTLAAIDKAT
jgi:hypothetical protein